VVLWSDGGVVVPLGLVELLSGGGVVEGAAWSEDGALEDIEPELDD
jgi:hypothetical protein